jgi:hypothetical protein
MPRYRQRFWLSAALLVPLLTVGLWWSVRGRSLKAVPKAPSDAVQVVADGLARNHPEVLWHALPPSYQADVRRVIGAFCTNMDAGIYDRAFRVLNLAVRVLKEKEEYFAKSPVALSTPMLESSLGRYWQHDVGLLQAIATSDLSTLARLRQMDPGDFLASTGHQVMAGLEDLRLRMQHSPGQNPWEKFSEALKQGGVQFVKTNNAQGYLRFNSATNGATKEVPLTQVEGRWVPAEMAASWKTRIAQAMQSLAKLNGPEFAQAKPMLSLVLGALETNLNSLLKAGSQKEFDERLKGFAAVGDMLRSLQALRKQGAG